MTRKHRLFVLAAVTLVAATLTGLTTYSAFSSTAANTGNTSRPVRSPSPTTTAAPPFSR